MDTTSNTRRQTLLVHLLACIPVAVAYMTTLAPSLDRIDAGELAAVQYTAGVAHPTGYPLFTLLGWLFSRLPLGSPIWRLNLLSMLFVTGGVFLFMRAAYFLVTIPKAGKGKSGNAPQAGKKATAKTAVPTEVQPSHWLERWSPILASILAGWALAFSRTVWEQSTSIEVYSLHILLLGLVFLTLTKAFMAPSEQVRPWIWLAVALGLSFSNHLTTVVMLPAIAVLFFAKFKLTSRGFKTLGIMLAVFFPLLILIYSWLPIRSASSPAMNWGSTDGWDYFWYHVTGRQFSVWWFKGAKEFNSNFSGFFAGNDKLIGVGMQFAWTGLLAGVAGLFFLLRRHLAMGLALLVAFATTLLYVCNYSIPDLQPYFLTCYVVIALGVGAAVSELLRMKSLPVAAKFGLGGIAIAGIALSAWIHQSKVDKHDLWMYDDYSRAALESLPQDAIVITFQWDHLVSEAYYLQQAEHVRPDVLIVEYEIMKDRMWYKDHLIRHAPELMARVKPELDAFYKALAPFYFEGDESAIPNLQRTWPRLVWKLITEGSKTRPVLLGPEVFHERINTQRGKEIELPPGYTVLPDAYFYRVVSASEAQQYLDIPARQKEVRMPAYEKKEDYYIGRMRWYMMVVAHDRAMYEAAMNKPDRARLWRDETLKLNPSIQFPPQMGAS